MIEPVFLAFALLAGGALGLFFFGGLWWTIRCGLASTIPALWFLGSLVVRTGVLLLGFWLVSQGHWDRALACAVGFAMGRLVVTRLTHHSADSGVIAPKGVDHAA